MPIYRDTHSTAAPLLQESVRPGPQSLNVTVADYISRAESQSRQQAPQKDPMEKSPENSTLCKEESDVKVTNGPSKNGKHSSPKVTQETAVLVNGVS